MSGLGLLKNCNKGNLEEVRTNYKAEKKLSLALGFCMAWGDEISKRTQEWKSEAVLGLDPSVTYYMT